MKNNNDVVKEIVKEQDEDRSLAGACARVDKSDVPSDDDLYGEFPCGLLYEGAVHKSFEFREMTGADEEAITSVAKKNSGAKLINKLLERCLTRIGEITPRSIGADAWRKAIESLSVPDQDFAMMKIRKVSLGDEIETSSVCPHCGEKVKTFFNIDELEILPYMGDDTQERIIPLPRGYVDNKGVSHNEVVMRLPNGLDREIALPIARTNESKALTLLLTRICKFTDGYPITEGILRDMKLRDRQELEKQNREFVKFGYQYTINVECPACEGEFETVLNGLKNFL